MEQQGKVILVTGAARSGKSEWAEELAHRSHQSVIYVATAQVDPLDPEWQRRIAQHQQRRPPTWQTRQVPLALAETIRQTPAPTCLLVDSLGTWLTNWLDQDDAEWAATVSALLESLYHSPNRVILVAEEVGWGVVPAYPLGRRFRDRLGALVREIGTIASPVYLVAGGHVLNLSAIATPLKQAMAAATVSALPEDNGWSDRPPTGTP